MSLFFNNSKADQEYVARLEAKINSLTEREPTLEVQKENMRLTNSLEIKSYRNELLQTEIDTLSDELTSVKQDLQKSLKENEANALALDEQSRELTALAEKDRVSLTQENIDLTVKNAELTAQVEAQEKVLDVSSDIIDVKEMVTQIISKLPEVKISSITANANSQSGK